MKSRWTMTLVVSTTASAPLTVITSIHRSSGQVKMALPLMSVESRQIASSATWPHATTRMPTTEYGTTRCATSG